jgi:hypothetical protein
VESKLEKMQPLEHMVPPDPDNRDFNENFILGDFDTDEKGNIILKENAKGQLVDKQGRVVNAKGYLIDPETGDIVEADGNKTVFKFSELDEGGELPMPFSLEKHNFNPVELLGNLKCHETTLRPLAFEEKDGEPADLSGRRVNRSGFLVDKDGNLID